ncbi:alpha-ketoacid dehydrogenase subunit beta [Mesoplasma syrphidae]|uniref:Alpha-ketoacid dehydrogenase subunit beta n=1 Tax=Mesoplasma syrphidae TaxID=225999 RepID=A0A2K9BIY1_9MOLU|nr:alpha-ketoacid dehydrogenase subunit beta [Mesoplasma syrphidae]AUF83246.1 alpha-ketoacid dehydrogenase subunit beta [Mesoplasma syrphidae]
MPLINNIKAVNQALDVAMERNQNVVTYGEDVGFEGGVFRATEGLQQKYGIERSFNAPISENLFIGAAIGMAINGLSPVVELQFEGLGRSALQNITTHLGKMRNRTRGKYTCPLVIRTPMGGGISALEHHSESFEAIYSHTPGLVVIIPSTPYDTKGLLLAAIDSPDPVIFLEPTKLYRAFKQEVPEGYYTVPIGVGYKIQEGDDLTIVTYGAPTVDCQKALELLKETHPEVTVDLIDLRTINPWDRDMVFKSVTKTGRLLIVNEAAKSFGVASEIIASVNENCFDYLKAPLTRCTGYDVNIPFVQGERWFNINPYKILDKIHEVLEY